jgi:cystathionine beta-lyase/cystathionine gamma-synthase
MKFATKAIRIGQEPDPTTGAVIVPIYQCANFAFIDVGNPKAFEYSRSGNPTRSAPMKNVWRHWKKDNTVWLSAAGMAAGMPRSPSSSPVTISSPPKIFTGGTFRLFEGVAVTRAAFVSPMWTAPGRRRLKTQSNDTKMIWIETPA